jgi:hypothetical protein
MSAASAPAPDELSALEQRRDDARVRREGIDADVADLTATLSTLETAIADRERERDEATLAADDAAALKFDEVAAHERRRLAAGRYRLGRVNASLVEAKEAERGAAEAYDRLWSAREAERARQARRDRLAGIPARCAEMIARMRALQRELGTLLIDAGDDATAWTRACGIAAALEGETLAAGETYVAVRGAGPMPGPLVVAATVLGPASPFTSANGVRVDPFARRPR